MPWISKRKKQLQKARESKRQKLQEPENQDPEQERGEEETLGSLSDYESEKDDDFEPENEELDVETMIHLYSNEWIDDLHRDDLMSLTIVLHHLLVTTLHFPLTRASQVIAELIGKSDRTVRDWRATFLGNSGSFPETLQGKYQRTGVLWQNEELNKKACEFVRANKAVKGRPNMKIACFARWVNEDLLPNHALEPGYPRKISQETARRWLHELGFCVLDSKKGTYVDGHERPDVTEYRGKFLRKMVALGFLNSENAPTPEAALSLPEDIDTPPAEQIAKTIVLFHDESTFQANDCERTQWGERGEHMLVPKSKGAGIMVSDFISEQDGYLKLSDQEFAIGRTIFPGLKQYARARIEYGENKDGYWTSDKFMEQLEYCATIAECKYPRSDGFKVVWIFDHSSCHGAFAEDALNAYKMNARPGGKQPLLRDTVWQGRVQKMVFSVGVAKGLIQVLKERGKYRNGMKLDEMRAELASHQDFKEEKTRIEHFLNRRGHCCLFLPKFHCEINPIERCWAQAKRFTRSHCNYTIGSLRKNVPEGLDSVSVENIQNYYRKVRHYMFGYLLGFAGGPDLEEQVKKMKKVYKSHRRVGVHE